MTAQKFPDVMVDIETTHTRPDRGAILQLAAVRFNVETCEIDPESIFDRSLKRIPGRDWNLDTFNWWKQQKAGLLQSIMERAEPADVVMRDFAQQFYPQGSVRLWAKPASFDAQFIESYFQDLEIVTPFSYRDTTDMNSYIRGRYRGQPVPDPDLDFKGSAHNALDDVLNQIEVLFWHVKNTAS